jgi:hypothetical protein
MLQSAASRSAGERELDHQHSSDRAEAEQMVRRIERASRWLESTRPD